MSIKAHQLMAWLSPGFPTGAFAYSHGLEYAIASGWIADKTSLQEWIKTLLYYGTLWNDAVLFSLSCKGEDVAALAQALAGSKERLIETTAQGQNFARIASALLGENLPVAPLPIVVATAITRAGISIDDALALYLHAQAANLISVAVRLVPIGQTDGQFVLQALFPDFDKVAARAQGAAIDDLGSAAFLSDIAAMRHEDMQTRIFQT